MKTKSNHYQIMDTEAHIEVIRRNCDKLFDKTKTQEEKNIINSIGISLNNIEFNIGKVKNV